MEHGFPGARDQHIVLKLGHMLPGRGFFGDPRVYQEPGKRGYASESDESVELTSHLQISFELDIDQATGGDGLGSYEAFKPMASNLISNIAYVEGSVRSVNSRLRHPTRWPGKERWQTSAGRHTSL